MTALELIQLLNQLKDPSVPIKIETQYNLEDILTVDDETVDKEAFVTIVGVNA